MTGYPEPWVYALARRDLATASTQEVRASMDAQRLIRRARNARKKARARGAWPKGARSSAARIDEARRRLKANRREARLNARLVRR